jgi:hypothetical protein
MAQPGHQGCLLAVLVNQLILPALLSQLILPTCQAKQWTFDTEPKFRLVPMTSFFLNSL